MLRLPLVAPAYAEPSPNLLELVTAADNKDRSRVPRVADVIESPAFVSFAMQGIDDDERKPSRETPIESRRHPVVRFIPHVVVGGDVDREPLRAFHPV